MTSALKIIDQELAQFGWVESIATNSISDFKSPNIDVEEQTTTEKESDLIDTFICHLIFYVVFCYSLFLYIIFTVNTTFSQEEVAKKILNQMSEKGRTYTDITAEFTLNFSNENLEIIDDKCCDIYLPIWIEVIVSYGLFIELTNFNSIKIF